MKKYYTQKEVCAKFTRFRKVNFETGQAAANHYGKLTKHGGMNRNAMYKIEKNTAAPNRNMLKDIGFKKAPPMYMKIKEE
jgi:hypothetical protein